MPNKIFPEGFDELSLIGTGFSPRHPSARVLTVKAGPDAPAEPKHPTFMQRVARLLKGTYMPDGVEVPDDIDGDGDGAEDYDQIARLLAMTYQDIQTAWQVQGDSARAALIKAAIDTFRDNYDDVCAGGDGRVRKAGRKHSAGTIATMRDMRGAMDAHHAKMTGMLDDEFGAEAMRKAAEDDDDGEPLAAGETPESVAAATDAALKEGE